MKGATASAGLFWVGLLAMIAPTGAGAQSAITEQEAHAIGVDAYLYFYPLISMDITRRVAINVEPGKMPGLGPANMFNNFTAFPTADFKAVVRPNFDTLYSSAFLDLTAEPVIVSAPDTAGRYFCCRCSTCGPTYSPHQVGEPPARRPAIS